MATPITTKVDSAPPKRTNKVITALRRFAISITIFNILGYTVLGFEQPWLYPFLAVGTAYTTEILLEIINAKVTSGRSASAATGSGDWWSSCSRRTSAAWR